MGSLPPRLHMLEISKLESSEFKAVFSMVYDGDASISLSTKVEANTLISLYDTAPKFTLPHLASSMSSLKMPLRFTITNFKLSGIITLVVSQKKGVVLVFQDDPLQSIKISSSLDSIPNAANRIKAEIEQELRLVFRTSIPELLYQLTKPSKSGFVDKFVEPACSVDQSTCSDDVNLSIPQPFPTTTLASTTSVSVPCIFDPVSVESSYSGSLSLESALSGSTSLSNSHYTNPSSPLSNPYYTVSTLPTIFAASRLALQKIKALASKNMTLSLDPSLDFNNIVQRSSVFTSTYKDLSPSHSRKLSFESSEIDLCDDLSSVGSLENSIEYPAAKSHSGQRRVFKLSGAFDDEKRKSPSTKPLTKVRSQSSHPKSQQQYFSSCPRRSRISFSASNSLPCTPLLSPQQGTSRNSSPDVRHRNRLLSNNYPPPLTLSPNTQATNHKQIPVDPSHLKLAPTDASLRPKSGIIGAQTSGTKYRSKSSGIHDSFHSFHSEQDVIYDNPTFQFAGYSKPAFSTKDQSNSPIRDLTSKHNLQLPFPLSSIENSLESSLYSQKPINSDTQVHQNGLRPPSYVSSLTPQSIQPLHDLPLPKLVSKNGHEAYQESDPSSQAPAQFFLTKMH